MGNRAVITTNADLKELGLYLHWNGGRDSVEGFLAYCKLKRYAPLPDDYGWAYLAGIVSNFMQDGLSVGVQVCSRLDCHNGDNGVYVVDKNWLIAERLFCSSKYAEQYIHSLHDMLKAIDSRMPEEMRLSSEQWDKFPDIQKEIVAQRDKTVYHP